MPIFSVSVLNDDNEISVIGNGTIIAITDYSNYSTSTETGHLKANFSNYKKITITNPDNTTYLFSSMGDGDALLSTPSVSTLPILTNYTYTTGDGVYKMTLISVPTWSDSVVYGVISTHCVYYNGLLYEAKVNSIPAGTLPTNTTYWTLVADDDLPAKYRVCSKFAIYCDALDCYLESVYNAYCSISTAGFCDVDFCKNEYAILSLKLDLLITEIDELVKSYDWGEVTNVINLTKTLCCCYE